jgi:hypothetical protein
VFGVQTNVLPLSPHRLWHDIAESKSRHTSIQSPTPAIR